MPHHVNREKRRQAFVAAAEALDKLVAHIARGGHWPECNREPEYYSRGFIHRLLAHAIRADEIIDARELWLLRDFEADELTQAEHEYWVKDTVDHFPDFPFQVPEFFRAACRHDAAENTSIAIAMIGLVGQMFDSVAMSDTAEHLTEHLLKYEMISTLYEALKEHS